MAGQMPETIEAPEAQQAAPEAPEAPEAQSSSPESQQPPAAGAPAAPRMFSEEQVQGMIRDRLKGYQTFGKPEDLQARLARAEAIEQWQQQLTQSMGKVPGQQAAPGAQLSEDDKKVQAYLERLYPGISQMKQAMQTMQSSQEQMEQFRWQQIAATNESTLKNMVAAAGYPEAQFQEIANRVAHSIMGNRQDYAAYIQNNGNFEVVKRHFEALDKWIKGFAPTPQAPAGAAGYAAAKGKTAGLPPRMPAAGVPAPTAQKQKLSKDQHVDAAFKALTGQ